MIVDFAAQCQWDLLSLARMLQCASLQDIQNVDQLLYSYIFTYCKDISVCDPESLSST